MLVSARQSAVRRLCSLISTRNWHRTASTATAAAAVTLNDDHLRVQLASGAVADYHYCWLRHNCDVDRHPQTGERIVDSSQLPDNLSVATARVEAGTLFVKWQHDGRESVYPMTWLDQYAYGRNRAAVARPPSDLSNITIEPASSIDQMVERALARLDTHGAVLVRRKQTTHAVSAEDETEPIIEAFLRRSLSVIPTHFGRIEDLRTDNTTNKNTDQLGYTNSAVEPHTDQPFIAKPPRYQLLQSIRPATIGGENFIVDGWAAAKYLRSVDAEAYELLSTVPVRFHRKQKAFESLVEKPILAGDLSSPAQFQIRYSYFTMAPHNVEFAKMTAFYRAYDLFARMVRDTRNQYRFLLNSGDFLLYDNHRMLHARTGFSGERWVRGIYFDHK